MLSPSAPHRSPPVEWLTLKINSVISNKLFSLFLLHSISSGDRFVLVAISFHNTVEQEMHNAEDVKKMNVLSNARALGRLIRKVQFPYLQEFSFLEVEYVSALWRRTHAVFGIFVRVETPFKLKYEQQFACKIRNNTMFCVAQSLNCHGNNTWT